MRYLESYFILGLIIVVFLDYLFETFDDKEMKFSSYGERFLYMLFWPFILYSFLKGYVKKDKN